MKYQEQREAFKRLMIQQGICKLEQLNQALPFGCSVPQPKIDKWLNRLLEVPTGFSTQKRYVNRFKLGADPEFIFTKNGQRQDAKNLDLQQGLAFGMDNNGRLTEIRPYPSRSALNVVASILSTLRWMTVFRPNTLLYNWQAGAYLMNDGIGGHVHFGRKRPGRDEEIRALDAIEEELEAVQAYPRAEILARRAGDAHNQHYGQFGDFRKQLHGYEYRTFPSWLDSPELAFLTITLAKLVVQNPVLAQGYIPLHSLDRHFQRIRNLLAYYKDMDDDARLALKLISKHFPVHIGGDFKGRWGIGPIACSAKDILYIPSCIKPNAEDVLDVFAHLSEGQPLPCRVSVPTWGPLSPPKGYQMVISTVNTHGAKGLGELVYDVCSFQYSPFVLINNRELAKGVFFSIPKTLADTLPADWRRFTGHKIVVHQNDHYVYSSEQARAVSTFMECRRLLLETVLPFWRISTVKADSHLQWKSMLVKTPKTRFVGKTLAGDLSALPITL